MGRHKKIIDKGEFTEDYCFSCKDGGHLRVCDYKNCLKAYHPDCVGKDPSFLESNERWICGWHSCFICQKSSTFQCFCCPSSLCRACIRAAEFVHIKKKMKGFCNNCLKLAILIEENADVDSDGGKVDFQDTETYEFLFKDYWQLVKEKEGLTLVDLHAADAFLKRGQNCNSGSDSDVLHEEEFMSDVDDLEDDDNDGISFPNDSSVERSRVKTPIRRSRSKRKKYIGWGSEELIEFLKSIGKDIEKPMSQYDVCEFVQQYVESNHLFHPEKKKKKVICDQRLHSLFRKKSMKFHKIYSMLENHFAANDDDFSSRSEEDDALVVSKWQRGTTSGSKSYKPVPNRYKEVVLEPRKSCYASIVAKNIQLVYLKRSLILELLKSPESFENMVMGCFVRVKNDPKYFYYSPQKHYQLGQVTAIKMVPHPYKMGETSTNIALRVSNMFDDIRISMLSDEDFEEEECEDLRQLVKKGLFRRPTVAELDKKIRIVHEYIMNHWIDREIRKLQKQIERANEKGWRRELDEYLERRVLLQKPEERMRLLKEIPEIIADTEEEIKATTSALLENTGNGDISREDVANGKAESLSVGRRVDSPEQRQLDLVRGARFDEDVAYGEAEGIRAGSPEQRQHGMGNGAISKEIVSRGETEAGRGVGHLNHRQLDMGNGSIPNEKIVKEDTGGISIKETSVIDIEDGEEEDTTDRKAKEVPIIDLDDDEEVPNGSSKDEPFTDTCEEISGIPVPERQKVWHYIDPSGNEQGPFPMSSLRYWMEEGFFDDDFKVWRTGQPREQAILLTDAVRLAAQ